MYGLLRPLLFRWDPETAHHRALAAARGIGRCAPLRGLLRAAAAAEDDRLRVEAMGMVFENPVGLAAGYDKDARAVAGLAALGFGHLELGTVTLKAQPGNPRPRIHRFAAERALVNSMGFPNAGVEALLEQSLDPRCGARIGINIGKNKDTPVERAAEDYCALLQRVGGRADYVAINVSSPNTPGLRTLQSRAALDELIGAVARTRDALPRRVPLLVKIAPDLTDAELEDVLGAILGGGVDGVIATNTTTDRSGLPPPAAALPGGTSGAPLTARADAFLRKIAARTAGRVAIIGVGGILTPADALARLRAGAHLVQLYSGLIFAGPFLVKDCLKEIAGACHREGLRSAAQLGAAARGEGSTPAQPRTSARG